MILLMVLVFSPLCVYNNIFATTEQTQVTLLTELYDGDDIDLLVCTPIDFPVLLYPRSISTVSIFDC